MSGSAPFDLLGAARAAAQGNFVPPPQISAPPRAPSFPQVPPHIGPDGTETNLSDADYAKFKSGQQPPAQGTPQPVAQSQRPQPSGAIAPSFDLLTAAQRASKGQFKYTSPPAPADKSTLGGIGRNFVAGATGTLSGIGGALANTGASSEPSGIDFQADAMNAQARPDATPMLNRGMESLGIPTPLSTQPHGFAERAANVAGGAVATLPFFEGAGAAIGGLGGLAGRIGTMMRPGMAAVVPTIAGAVAGQGASEAVPDNAPGWVKTVADLAGNVLGGGVAALGQEGARALYQGGRDALGLMGIGGKTTIGGQRVATAQAQRASDTLAQAAGGEPQLQQAVSAQNAVPAGYEETLAQASQNRGLRGLEEAARTSPDHAPKFLQQRAGQNAAEVAALRSLAPPTGDPSALGAWVAQRVDALDNAGEWRLAAGRYGVGRMTERMGGHTPVEEQGAATREALGARNQSEGRRIDPLFRAIDPDGTMALPSDAVRESAGRLAAERAQAYSKGIDPLAQQSFDDAGSMPDWVKFGDLKNYRESLNEDLATARRNGNARAVRQLTILKSGVSKAIADAVASRVQNEARLVAAGRMAPGDTLESRLAHWKGNGTEPRAKAAVGRDGSEGLEGLHAGKEGVPSGVFRAEGDRNQRLGSASGSARVSAAARSKTPSLLTFLTRRGGVNDPGGDLAAMDAGKARVGFYRTKGGETLDSAREAAEEAGYLGQGSDTNELLDAISEELHGRKIYPIHEQAEMEALDRAEAARTADGQALDKAHDAVEATAREIGEHLSPDEFDHAVELAARGMHPQEAIEEAARAQQERVISLETAKRAFGPPGTEGLRQGELPGTGRPAQSVEGLTPLDERAAKQLDVANAAHAERKATFSQGAVGRVLKRGEGGYQYSVKDANVLGRFFTGNEAEGQNVDQLAKALGGADKMAPAGREYLVSDLRSKGIIQPDGTLNRKSYSAWRQRHERGISRIPGLSDEFSSIDQAQRAVDDATAAHAAQMKAVRNGALKNILNGEEPNKVVARAIANPQEFRKITALARQNKDAEAGWQRAVAEYLVSKTVKLPNGEDGGLLKSDQFSKFFDANKPLLKQALGGQGVNTLEMIAAAERRRLIPASATRGSDTAYKFNNAAKHGFGKQEGFHATAFAVIGEQLGQVIEHAMGGSGVTGEIAGAAIAGGGYVVHAMRQAGIKKVNDLLVEALLHPALARELVQKVPPKASPLFWKRIGTAIQSATLADLSAQDQDNNH